MTDIYNPPKKNWHHPLKRKIKCKPELQYKWHDWLSRVTTKNFTYNEPVIMNRKLLNKHATFITGEILSQIKSQ